MAVVEKLRQIYKFFKRRDASLPRGGVETRVATTPNKCIPNVKMFRLTYIRSDRFSNETLKFRVSDFVPVNGIIRYTHREDSRDEDSRLHPLKYSLLPFRHSPSRTRVPIPRRYTHTHTQTRTRPTRESRLTGIGMDPSSQPPSHFPSHRAPPLRFLIKHSRRRLAILVALRI